MREIKEEKCICCNGTGKQQVFDNKQIKYINCKHCKGTGKRKYYLINTGFFEQKKYVDIYYDEETSRWY
jgi:RecJ-like exonuclease